MPNKPTTFKNKELTISDMNKLVDGVNHISTLINETILYSGEGGPDTVISPVPEALKGAESKGTVTLFITTRLDTVNGSTFYLYAASVVFGINSSEIDPYISFDNEKVFEVYNLMDTNYFEEYPDYRPFEERSIKVIRKTVNEIQIKTTGTEKVIDVKALINSGGKLV